VKKGEKAPKTTADPAAVSQQFFQEVENAKIRELYEHYKQDFQIFGYTADQYYS
jgi:hypothetical protein